MKVLFQRINLFNPKLILLQLKVIIVYSDTFLLDLEERANAIASPKKCWNIQWNY